jgi:hypothetical protein
VANNFATLGGQEWLVAPNTQIWKFQNRVLRWVLDCFGFERASDRTIRNDRFIEEALELIQATGSTRERAHELVDYVFDRPMGAIKQEVGGTMVTLAALCLANGVDMHECGETELARILDPLVMEKIRAKDLAKPEGSARPVP